MNVYEIHREKVFDTTLEKIPLWTKFRLLFVKKQFSEDFINDNGENELWTRTTYKILDGKCYILDFKSFYIKRHSHFMRKKDSDD